MFYPFSVRVALASGVHLTSRPQSADLTPTAASGELPNERSAHSRIAPERESAIKAARRETLERAAKCERVWRSRIPLGREREQPSREESRRAKATALKSGTRWRAGGEQGRPKRAREELRVALIGPS